MTPEESLRHNFKESFGLSDEAIVFLMKVWDAIQFFDDIADGDKTERKDLDVIIWDFFIGFSEDPYFQKHMSSFKSQLATMILKWQALRRYNSHNNEHKIKIGA